METTQPEDGAQVRLSVAGIKNNHLAAIKDKLGCSVSCAAVAICASRAYRRNKREVFYSRSARTYDLPKRYQDKLYTFKKVRQSVDDLSDMGLVVNNVVPPRHLGWSSWFETKSALDDSIGSLAASFRLRASSLTETILLKDNDGVLIDYKDTRETRSMRADMLAANEAVAGVEVLDRDGNDVAAPMRRIFKGDFASYGRLYGAGDSWQNIPNRSGERLGVTIDGEAVHEVDFRSMAANMLRVERGLAPLRDAYAIGDQWHCDRVDPETGEIADVGRSLVKIAFQVVSNIGSERGARVCLRDHPTMFAFEPEATDAERMMIASHLIRDLKVAHEDISDSFFTNVSARLQRADSDIANSVLKLCRRVGVVALPIHDSFIIAKSKVAILEEAMAEAASMHGYAGLEFKRT